MLDLIRKELDCCDNLLHFNLVHAAAGGTSGYGCKLMDHIAEKLMRTTNAFSLYPSKSISDSCMESYNTVLCTKELMGYMSSVHMFDNETLCNICTRELGLSNANYADFNKLIATYMANLTAPLRFHSQSQLSISPAKMIASILPDRDLKFFIPSLAPLQSTKVITPKSLLKELFHKRNYLCRFEGKESEPKVITCAIIYRGCNSTILYDKELKAHLQGNAKNFVDWVPNNVTCGYCDIPDYSFAPQSACRVTVSNAMATILNTITDRASEQLSSGMSFMWYQQKGMTTNDFDDAIERIKNVSEKYDEYCGVGQD